MSLDRLTRLIDQITDSLDRERDLLIEGAYDTIADEAAARQAQIERLAALPVRGIPALAPRLDRLRRLSARNAGLLRAAIDGAAAGRRRVEEIMEARSRLLGYDAKGAPVDNAVPVREGRRA